MQLLEWLIISLYAANGIYQLVLARQLVLAFCRPAPKPLADEDLKPALMVLSLKGGDPELVDCLHRLTSQDYPRYLLRLVIDSEQDEAWPIAEKFLHENPAACCELITLGKRRSTCSGKISGMLKGTEELEGFEFVAFIDGDARIESDCLRIMAAALNESNSGVVSGNRWYKPNRPHWGTMCQYVWNGYAVPMMNSVQIPWGGCLAVKAGDLEAGELRNKLNYAFGEDSTIAAHMLAEGRKVEFLPDLMILNKDDCGFRQIYNFIVRQFLTVRLHNPRWPRVVIYNFCLNLMILAALILAIVPTPVQQAFLVGGAILFLTLFVQISITQKLVRQKIRARSGESIFWITPAKLCLFPLSILLTNVVNLVATTHSVLAREHLWRGLRYRFGGQPPVQIINNGHMQDSSENELLPEPQIQRRQPV